MTDSRRGFTLIELILAIAICGAMLIGALQLHHEAERVREVTTTRMEATGAARLLMDRITVELLGASDTEPFGGRLEGHRDRVEFHTTNDGGGLVGYRYRREAPEAGDDEGDRQQRQRREPRVVGVERTRVSATSIAAHLDDKDNAVADEANDEEDEDDEDAALLVSDRLRYLRFRYHDGERWHDGWQRKELPRGVEVTAGVEPLAHGRRHHEYDGDIFRRVVSIPDSTTRGWNVPRKRENEGGR